MSSHDQPANGRGGPAPMEPYEEWTVRQADPTGRDAERQDDDALRRAGRRTAMVTAAAHALPWGVVMWVSATSAAGTARAHYAAGWAYTSAPPTPPPYLPWLLTIGGTCWTVCTACRAALRPPRRRRLPSARALGAATGLPRAADPPVAARTPRSPCSGGGCLGLLGAGRPRSGGGAGLVDGQRGGRAAMGAGRRRGHPPPPHDRDLAAKMRGRRRSRLGSRRLRDVLRTFLSPKAVASRK